MAKVQLIISVAVVLGIGWQLQGRLIAAENKTPDSTRLGYVLGPGDQVTLVAMEIEEISQKPFRIDNSGYIDIPLAGRVKAGGLSIMEFQQSLKDALRKYVRDPQVSVIVTEFRSQPISVMGAVNTPGVHYLQGNKTLMEALSLAGGLRTDAGHTATITRRLEAGHIPLPGAVDNPAKGYSVAEVDVKSVLEGKHPEENILVKGDDVISVPKAEVVYVIGEVAKSGGFTLGEHDHITVLQALSLAGGLSRAAAPKSAKILRSTPGAKDRAEVPINISKLLSGKTPDVPLGADDILFIPNSKMKAIAARAAEVAVNAGSGILIWRTGL